MRIESPPSTLGSNSWFAILVYGVLGSLTSFIVTFHTMDSSSDFFQAMFMDKEDTFDFIIVGGGSAGSVVANRLSEHFKVLLLEAGGEQSPVTFIPSLAFVNLDRPHIDWQYYTIPQKTACLSMNNQQCYHPRGLGLGGSSTLNFMIYIRGHPYDFDNWANITGDPRWSYAEILPYFKKSEDYTGEWDNPLFHSHDGYLKVSQPPYKGMAEEFCQACSENEIPRIDLNGPQFVQGCSPIYNTEFQGRRHSTYSAFIEPIRNRPNLFIYKFSLVNKVHINENNRAYAVQYTRHNKQYMAFAKREIILSAGSYGSPMILMRSGIGPRSHLEEHNIPIRMDLPVGQNLQDHISTFIGPFVIDQPLSMVLDRDMTINAITEYLRNGDGPASSTGIQATSFIVSSIAQEKDELQSVWPDIQYLLLGTGVYQNLDQDYSRSFNIQPGVLDNFLKPLMGKDSFQIVNMLSRPITTGEVLLSSTDPKAKPLINPRYLENEEDVRVMVEGAKRAVEIVEKSKTLQGIRAKLSSIPFPSCSQFEFRSFEYWECHSRHYSMTIYHPVGTCSMGPKDSKNTVVDSELRVIGIQGLRVIDASIMPKITTGNTNAPTIMIGERGADFILDYWRGNFS